MILEFVVLTLRIPKRFDQGMSTILPIIAVQVDITAQPFLYPVRSRQPAKPGRERPPLLYASEPAALSSHFTGTHPTSLLLLKPIRSRAIQLRVRTTCTLQRRHGPVSQCTPHTGPCFGNQGVGVEITQLGSRQSFANKRVPTNEGVTTEKSPVHD